MTQNSSDAPGRAYPPLPPSITASQAPLFHQMNEHPKRFERLARALMRRDPRFQGVELFGTEGQAQFGADLVARDSLGQYTDVASCKCYGEISAAKITIWADDFLKHRAERWPHVQRFILITAALNATSTQILARCQAEAERFRTQGLEFEHWGPDELFARVGEAPASVARLYLGPSWADTLFGPDGDRHSGRDGDDLISGTRLFQVPRAPNLFVGREAELNEIAEALTRNDAVVIASPMPGIGKTRLAIHAATQLAANYPDGVFWIAGGTDAADTLLGTLSAIGVDLEGGAREEGQRTSALSRALMAALVRRSALVVYDDVRFRENVGALIPPGTATKFVLTSKVLSELDLDRVHVLRTQGLVADAAIDLFAQTSERSVADRATRRDALALVEELGGLPLAIRLAGRAIKGMACTFAEYRERLTAAETFEEIDGEGWGATLAASFFLSLSALPHDQDRALFRCVGSVFCRRPPIGSVAAALQMDDFTVRLGVRRLCLAGLAEPLSRDGRIVFHPLLKRYAQQLSRAHPIAGADGRVGAWFESRLAVRKGDGAYEYNRPATADTIEAALAAVHHLLAAGENDRSVGIAEAVADPLTRIGRHEVVVDLTKALIKGEARSAWLDLYLADFTLSGLMQGDRDAALHLMEACSEGDHPRLAAAALTCRARDAYRRNSIAETEELLLRAKAIHESIDPPNDRGVAYVLNELGRLPVPSSDRKRALRFHRQALEIQTRIGDTKGRAHSLRRIGSFYLRRLRDTKKAAANLRAACAAAEEAGSMLIQIHALVELAEVEQLTQDFESALTHLDAARTLAAASSEAFSASRVESRRGQLFEKLELWSSAKAAYEEAVQLYPDPEAEARLRTALSRVEGKLQKTEVEVARLTRDLDLLTAELEDATDQVAIDRLRAESRHARRMIKRSQEKLGQLPLRIRMRGQGPAG